MTQDHAALVQALAEAMRNVPPEELDVTVEAAKTLVMKDADYAAQATILSTIDKTPQKEGLLLLKFPRNEWEHTRSMIRTMLETGKLVRGSDYRLRIAS